MALGDQRVLMKRGRIRLIDADPASGICYSVTDGSLGIWRGESLIEAQRQFREAVMTKLMEPDFKSARGA